MIIRPASSQAQDRESSPVTDQRSTTGRATKVEIFNSSLTVHITQSWTFTDNENKDCKFLSTNAYEREKELINSYGEKVSGRKSVK